MHRVFLIPGFFGFVHLGDLRYFGHVHRYLTAAFDRAGVPARIIEVDTLPTASLSRRAERLQQRVRELSEPGDIVHLIGHSSGGLDARLFASRGVSLGEGGDTDALAQRVRSVISVATPHRGTPAAASFNTLAGKRLLQLLSLMTVVVIRRGSLPLAVMLEIGQQLRRLTSTLDDGASILDELYAGLLGELDDERRDHIQRFFSDVGADQALLPQITPDAMDPFNVTTVDRPGVRYGCVVTRARPPGLHGVLGAGASPYAHGSNALYVANYSLARLSNGPAIPDVLRTRWPELKAADNDGMVPTISQLWGDLIATADADHLDIIGHFTGNEHDPPHYDWIRTGTGYRRPDFEATWSAVADALLGRDLR